MTHSIGVDIGGTNLRAAVVEADGTIHEVHRQRVQDRSVDGLAKSVRAAVDSLGSEGSTGAVGVGIAGSVRAEEGVVAVAPQLGWREAPFGAALQRELGRPVRLVNDLSAICYGEAKVGAGRGSSEVTCLFVGTGVGVGVVTHGRLLEGEHGLATEFGHVRVELSADARQCNCGMRGCIEAYLGGTHLPARLREVARDSKIVSPLIDRDDLNSSVIESHAVNGDPAATALWADCAVKLAWAIGALIMTFNPKVLVLGGGVLGTAPSLIARAEAHLPHFAWESFRDTVSVCTSALGDDAGILGAALLARDEHSKHECG
ncbi:MAG: ROK family protein [Myxococcota bacterium]